MSWKVTVRHGSSVGRKKFHSLEQAVDEARGRVDDVRRQDRLPPISFLREFAPDQRVAARIEISGPGFFRSREGGIDVMGDGGAIAYVGAIRKERIAAGSLDEVLAELARRLER